MAHSCSLLSVVVVDVIRCFCECMCFTHNPMFCATVSKKIFMCMTGPGQALVMSLFWTVSMGTTLSSSARWEICLCIHIWICLLVDLHEYHMYLCNELCLAGRSASWPFICLAWQKHWCWTVHPNCLIKFFLTWHACRYHWLLPFYTTFSALDLAWGSQDQLKTKPIGFICLHTFHLLLLVRQMKIPVSSMKMVVHRRSPRLT